MRMAIALSGVLLVSACLAEDVETTPVSGDALAPAGWTDAAPLFLARPRAL